MIIYIDADACPVTEDIIKVCEPYPLTIILVKSYAHFSHRLYHEWIKEIYVDSEKEAVDYKILSMINKGDVLVTQDYGLASLALQKSCYVIHPKGFQYTAENINQLLASRYHNAQLRKQGGRTKGPKPFLLADHERFQAAFNKLLNTII
ncbi:YaiI/YqxD family protein [Amphibacillus jilinensis]|uniref:YaiI/YqxD family protein n=1 Tax=Amphibacillus jilinensis TaxID=1216008 RepID=UPI0002ED9EF0|nr:YaiI/YqxD family protein [Amphibacillus jilinensis]